MSAHEKTGGAAFPMPANEYAGHGPEWGMTLRDYFAAKAVAGYLAHPVGANAEPIVVARWGYEMADAMLAARIEE